jgi:hypothetical protein
MKITLDSEEVSARIGGRTAQHVWERAVIDITSQIEEQTVSRGRTSARKVMDVCWKWIASMEGPIAAQAREDYNGHHAGS